MEELASKLAVLIDYAFFSPWVMPICFLGTGSTLDASLMLERHVTPSFHAIAHCRTKRYYFSHEFRLWVKNLDVGDSIIILL
ncbi:MAG: hypothetical protein ICV82_06375 [Nitrososphaera sp.]|nr:hypothetical protein [Nitrososphaera sp.]